jgi:hypothetical protein
MTSTRRGFLSRAALAGGALVLPSGLLTTVGGGLTGCTTSTTRGRRTDHYVVFYLMVGGWDLMLTTDPVARKEGFFMPWDDDENVDFGGVKLGPAMGPLKPFADQMGIMRGIHVDALNHPQARFRMVTGKFKPPGNVVTAPSVQTLIAQARSSDYELPNLSSDQLRPATFRGNIADPRLEPVRVASITQLRGMTTLKGEVGPYRREIEEALQAKDALTEARWKTGSSSSLAGDFRTFAEVERHLAQSDYGKRVAGAETMKDQAKSAAGRVDRVENQVRLAIEAVRLDLAPVVTVGTGEFDSHNRGEYASHPNAVKKGIRAVAAIAQGLQDVVLEDGRTLFDMTTIVVTSEFSRAPSKNELGGKHHWPTNSIIMLGKGVAPGRDGAPRVFGITDENLVAQPINPRNGSTDNGADALDMSHGLATILAIAGVDPHKAIGQEPVLDLLA